MKQLDFILTQPMKASLQDFPVALFYSAVRDVSKFWVCVWNPKVWNLFFQKLIQGEIFLFAYLIAALARLDRAEPMNDAHYNVTNYA